MKRFVYLFIYILSIIICLVVTNRLIAYLYSLDSKMLGQFLPIIVIELIHAVYPILIGGLLAIPYLIRTLKKPGTVHYDLSRALAIGIPTLFMSSSILIYLLFPNSLFSIFSKFFKGSLISTYQETFTISGVILGYSLLTSINKRESKE